MLWYTCWKKPLFSKKLGGLSLFQEHVSTYLSHTHILYRREKHLPSLEATKLEPGESHWPTFDGIQVPTGVTALRG